MKLKALSCGVLLGLLSTSALANDFSINVGAISVMPDDSSSNLNVVETVAGLPVRPAIHVEGRQVGCAPDVVGIEAFQCVHVGAGAEGAARARQHDHADIVIGAS